MSRAGSYSELAGSLATVAIASLGGPVPAVKAALAEVVKLGRARYEADAAARDLYRNVAEVVEGWAEGERLVEEDVRLGLALATETIARFGLDRDAIAALNFEPGAAAGRVLEAARSADRRWGSEDHYAVAERAVTQAYGALIRQFEASETILLPAVRALRRTLDDYTARIEAQNLRTEATLGELAAALVAAATVAEVMSYLRTRIADWDVSIWHPGAQPPSLLERRLWVRATGSGPSVEGEEVTAEEALVGQRMLLVLGGPGSGKTWLARRYVREAARAALLQLEGGAIWKRWRCRCSPPGTDGLPLRVPRGSLLCGPRSPQIWGTGTSARAEPSIACNEVSLSGN